MLLLACSVGLLVAAISGFLKASRELESLQQSRVQRCGCCRLFEIAGVWLTGLGEASSFPGEPEKRSVVLAHLGVVAVTRQTEA